MTTVRTVDDAAAEPPRTRTNALTWAWPASVAVMLVVLGVVDVWWLERFRRGFPLDIDESGYLWFAFTLQDALRDHSLIAFFHGFQHEGWVAPLLPITTAVAGVLGIGKHIVLSLAVQLVFFAVLVFASYGIGSRLRGRGAGALTALAVATVPSVTEFVRSYHLVVPSTAMLTLSVFALLASRRLRDLRWTLVWGVAMGLTLLARSMMLAFVPAVLAAGLWIAAVDRARGRRLVNLGLGVGAFAATSLLWYATSWRPILDYLVHSGYGQKSHSYGPTLSALTREYWTHELTGAIQHSLYLPLAAAMLATLAVAAAAALRRLAPPSSLGAFAGAALRAARSDHVVLLIVVGEGYLALTSSTNDGTGFVVPLLPCAVALTVSALFSVPWTRLRAALVAALVAVSVFNVVMKADVVASVSRVRTVEVPGYVRVTVTNGEGYIHEHLSSVGGYTLGPPTHWLPDREREWTALFERIARRIEAMRRPWLLVDFAPQEPVLNTSALRLHANRTGFVAADYEYVDTGGDDTVEAYRRFLADERPDVLVTTDRAGRNFGPVVSPDRVVAAARSVGFAPVARFRTPDGRELRLWTRTSR